MTSDTITQLSPQLLNLYEDGLYSDLVIECDDRRWCVHRAVVHLSPPSFAASGEIGEDEEGGENTIVLDRDIPELMDLIVRYFYTQDYNDNGLVAEIEENLIYHTFFPASDIHTSQNDEIKSSKDDEDNAILIPTAAQLHNCLLINSYIYSLAESLEIPKLKYLAVQKFISRLGDSGNWPYYQFSKIVAAVLKITTKDDRSLRVIVQDVLIEHASEILGREGQDCVGYHEGREDWLAVLRKDADFVLAIWEKTVASKQ